MRRKLRVPGFGIYFDPKKSTSGQRFFESLCKSLAREAVPLTENPATILFNVSAPISEIVRAKLKRQKIVLRIDGLYFDRLSPAFLVTFPWPIRWLLSLGLRYRRAHDLFAFLANLVNENYSAFARILLADRVVYQSNFSRLVHRPYFPSKPADIIVNGSEFCGEGAPNVVHERIRLITIHDDWKPAKRVDHLVEFVRWANDTRQADIELTILGYTGKLPTTVSSDVRALIETAAYIRTVGRFKSFDGDTRRIMLDHHIYATFSYRDPCPNTVVEAMAHGLPVVACASGGLPDIVRDAGVLLPLDDFQYGFFACHRYENDFPPLNFARVLGAIKGVMANLEMYRGRVKQRFIDDLSIELVATRYSSVLRTAAEQCR